MDRKLVLFFHAVHFCCLIKYIFLKKRKIMNSFFINIDDFDFMWNVMNEESPLS